MCGGCSLGETAVMYFFPPPLGCYRIGFLCFCLEFGPLPTTLILHFWASLNESAQSQSPLFAQLRRPVTVPNAAISDKLVILPGGSRRCLLVRPSWPFLHRQVRRVIMHGPQRRTPFIHRVKCSSRCQKPCSLTVKPSPPNGARVAVPPVGIIRSF
jgi:hypothetical protein